MTTHTLRRRSTAASVGLAVAFGSIAAGAFAGSAQAVPSRTATTAVDTTYLADTLGLPANTVVETVTYDRFQWLLQQPGQYAFLIGDQGDAGFKANAVAVDAAARAAGASKIYWYDPNLSGYSAASVPAAAAKNLDTRNPSGINLDAASQKNFGDTWKNLLGQYLGNGFKSAPNAGQTTAVVTADDTVVNDTDAPLWDYRTGQTPAVSTTDDVFFVYDKDHTAASAPDKVISWVNLSTDAAVSTSTTTALTAAGGGAVIDQLDQFAWWKSSANRKHDLAYADDLRYGGDILTDADAADGWNVKQITYPELLHLLNINDPSNPNFVLLFGGTWCHNTRAVIKDVNAQAVDNGTTVYNFDLVLDGGTTNGTNGGGNPIHIRDNAANSLGTIFNFRPSYLYGDLVRAYFKNLVTEYDPNTGTRVAYYPGGDLTKFPDVVRKLQVPFLINYQRGTGGSPSSTTVKRQWIQQNIDASTGLPTFKEYMSEWWFTHPSAQLGLAASPAPTQPQLDQAQANKTFGLEAVAKLDNFFGGLPGGVKSTQTVTAPAVTYGTAPTVTLAVSNNYGRISAGTATLGVAGKNYPVAVSQNSAVFTVDKLAAGSYPYTITYPGDDQLQSFTKSGTITVNKAQAPAPSLGVVTLPTSRKAGTILVTIPTAAGQAPASGTVTVQFTKRHYKTKTVTGTFSNGSAIIAVPRLSRITWNVSISYSGDSNYVASSAGTLLRIRR